MKAQVLPETLALPSGYIMPTADTRFSLLSHTTTSRSIPTSGEGTRSRLGSRGAERPLSRGTQHHSFRDAPRPLTCSFLPPPMPDLLSAGTVVT